MGRERIGRFVMSVGACCIAFFVVSAASALVIEVWSMGGWGRASLLIPLGVLVGCIGALIEGNY